MFASPASAQSLGDRFKSLFGGKSEEPTQGAPPPPAPDGENDLSCPPVSIRAGASTYAVAAPGKQPIGNDLRYQATITRTARECTKTGDQIMRRFDISERDRTQNRCPILLIALLVSRENPHATGQTAGDPARRR